jgi:hypothetical protein
LAARKWLVRSRKLLLELDLFEGGPLYWAIPSKPPDVTKLLDAPVYNDEFNSLSYEFPNVRVGTSIMLYWTSLTVVKSLICQIYEALDHLATLSPIVGGKLEDHHTTNERSQTFQIPLSTHFRAFPTLARNICQSIEFCLRDEMGILSIIAPLNMILVPLKSWPGLN